MYHRKNVHINIIRQCKYFENGECKFNTNCWYKHSEITSISEEQTSLEKQSYKCNSCGEDNLSRNNLMMHRKKEHAGTISVCKGYLNGTCKRSPDNCWYVHKDDKIEADFNLDFQEVMEIKMLPEPQ